MAMAFLALMALTFTSCEGDDFDTAANLNGTWRGSLGQYYSTVYGDGYAEWETDFVSRTTRVPQEHRRAATAWRSTSTPTTGATTNTMISGGRWPMATSIFIILTAASWSSETTACRATASVVCSKPLTVYSWPTSISTARLTGPGMPATPKALAPEETPMPESNVTLNNQAI